jgi:hypothetical protein
LREHSLLLCPQYSKARALLYIHLRLQKHPTAAALLSNIDWCGPLLDFIKRMGRFPPLKIAPEVKAGIKN